MGLGKMGGGESPTAPLAQRQNGRQCVELHEHAQHGGLHGGLAGAVHEPFGDCEVYIMYRIVPYVNAPRRGSCARYRSLW